MDQNTFVGNDSQTNANQSLSQAEGGNEQKIDPGAIRKSTTQSILNALSNASGSQFGSVEEALAFMARTSVQTKSDGNAQPVDNQQNQNRSNRVTANDLQEQFSKLQQDLARKDQALREKELDGDIQRAMGDKFDSDLLDYALNKVKSNIQWNNLATGNFQDNLSAGTYVILITDSVSCTKTITVSWKGNWMLSEEPQILIPSAAVHYKPVMWITTAGLT